MTKNPLSILKLLLNDPFRYELEIIETIPKIHDEDIIPLFQILLENPNSIPSNIYKSFYKRILQSPYIFPILPFQDISSLLEPQYLPVFNEFQNSLKKKFKKWYQSFVNRIQTLILSGQYETSLQQLEILNPYVVDISNIRIEDKSLLEYLLLRSVLPEGLPSVDELIRYLITNTRITPQLFELILERGSLSHLKTIFHHQNTIRDYLSSIQPIAMISKSARDRDGKIIYLLLSPYFDFSPEYVSFILQYIPSDWNHLTSFYERYHDLDVLKSVLRYLDISNSKVQGALSVIICDAIEEEDEEIVEFILSLNIPLECEDIYKKSVQYGLPKIQRAMIQRGYKPPQIGKGRFRCNIQKLECSNLQDEELIQRFAELEDMQSEYFIDILPLSNGCDSDSTFFFIASHEDTVCGSMMVTPYSEDNTRLYEVQYFSTQTLLNPAVKGVGRDLMDALIQDAKENRIDYIQLYPLKSAKSFYIKMGFVPSVDPTFKYYYYILNPEYQYLGKQPTQTTMMNIDYAS